MYDACRISHNVLTMNNQLKKPVLLIFYWNHTVYFIAYDILDPYFKITPPCTLQLFQITQQAIITAKVKKSLFFDKKWDSFVKISILKNGYFYVCLISSQLGYIRPVMMNSFIFNTRGHYYSVNLLKFLLHCTFLL